MFIESGTITAGAMGAFIYGISRYGAGAMAGGLAFQALTFGQLFHSFSCRSETAGIFTKKKLPRNPYMNWAIGGSIAMQIFSLFFPPLRALLGLSAINLMDGLVISAASTLPFMFKEVNKAVKERLSIEGNQPDKDRLEDNPLDCRKLGENDAGIPRPISLQQRESEYINCCN
jgi:Ca2+-transporting ATPase